MNLVNESIDDILKPKEENNIINSIIEEIRFILLENNWAAFYHSWNKYKSYVFKQKEVNSDFVKQIKKLGPGLYVLYTRRNNIYNILNNIYNVESFENIIKINIKPDKIDECLSIIIKHILDNYKGETFYFKYINPINESLNDILKPKKEDLIIKDVIDYILNKYETNSIAIYYALHYFYPKVSLNTGDSFYYKIQLKYNLQNGLFIGSNDNYDLLDDIIYNKLTYKKIGITFYFLDNTTKEQDKKLITELYKKIINKEIDTIYLKKFE